MDKLAKSILAVALSGGLLFTSVNAAIYRVIETGEKTELEYTFAQKENALGEKALAGAGIYNFPVQYQYFKDDDFDNIKAYAKVNHERVIDLHDLQDFTALKAGTATANDLAWVKLWLLAIGDLKYQKVGDSAVLAQLNGELEEIVIFDSPFADGQLTRSTTNVVSGITDEGWIFGSASAPYLPLDFIETDNNEVTYWLRDFTRRGFLTTDKGSTIKSIMPPQAEHGGESAILAINNNRVAVGYASTGLNVQAREYIEDESGGCADQAKLESIPYQACVQERRQGLYHLSAYKWVLDENGEVSSSENLGTLVTPHGEDERVYIAKAQAINNLGVAVGFAHGWWDEKETEPAARESRNTYAVVYKDGAVKDFTGDHSQYYNSEAVDINDQGIAIGHVWTNISGEARSKFYYVDTNADDMQMVLPQDFFTGSSSVARAINESGMVVGNGEVETHNASSIDPNEPNPRRRHAFLYDLNQDRFTNINDLLPCDSPYTVIEASDINVDNEIFANAIVKVDRRDAKGELMHDADGVVDKEDVVRAVKLVPIAGEAEACNAAVEQVQRQGAGLSLLLLFVLFSFALRSKLNFKG
ncbi:DUF3466 family protein [Thalassomonas actiniarum]|uniref:DUF3466 family protein n=1 Tax=Thalassomonas actiniarum TaxID=485447 RepID=A0AAE9YXP5_9GAMM|nr:DUF3466 family protein [Thalassomonas actiniarum]WDE01433.1 DUF3466 family protein [Thalassomonas actiniarum]